MMNRPHPGVPILLALTPAIIQQFSRSEASRKLGLTYFMSPIQLQMCSSQINMLKERIFFLTEQEKNIFSLHTLKYKDPEQQQTIKLLIRLKQKREAANSNQINSKKTTANPISQNVKFPLSANQQQSLKNKQKVTKQKYQENIQEKYQKKLKALKTLKQQEQRQTENNQQNLSFSLKLYNRFKAFLSKSIDPIEKDSQVTWDCEIDIQQKQELLQNQQTFMLKKQR